MDNLLVVWANNPAWYFFVRHAKLASGREGMKAHFPCFAPLAGLLLWSRFVDPVGQLVIDIAMMGFILADHDDDVAQFCVCSRTVVG